MGEEKVEEIKLYLEQLFDGMGVLNRDSEEVLVDSLQFMSLVIEIEEHFDIQISSNDLKLDSMQSIDDYVAIIINYLE